MSVSAPARNLPPVVGECQCGCGERTWIADRNDAARGWTRGEPVRYVRGHRRRGPFAYTVEDCGYSSPCWVWAGRIDGTGYGRWGTLLAYRVAWERAGRVVPAGLQLDHLCRNRACLNPNHLEPVSHAENARRGLQATLTFREVDEIRVLAGVEPQRSLARRFGVSQSQISRIVNHQSWAVT